MDKKWNILFKISDDFINRFPSINRVVLQLLFNRGIKDEKEINEFLYGSFDKNLNDPYLFKDMEKAVDFLIEYIKKKEKIVVFGDYDADGVTAAALLYELLKIFKANVDIYIPDRVTEGYGMNKEAIDEVAANGARLIVTVDNGIRNKEEVDYAKKLGIKIIITDHHPPPSDRKDLPECLIIDPMVEGEDYPFKDLAGVGVAYKLGEALIKKSKLDNKQKELLIKRMLDLNAIGTVADCVGLTGENRIFVKAGLGQIEKTRRLGLRELIKVSGLIKDKALDSWNIGFQIGPRLNAAGRMEHANTAFELLITENKEEAVTLARRLDSRNSERQEITENIVNEVEKSIDPKDKIIIGIYQGEKVNAWNEGVVGLVASRIREKYYRPTLIATKADDGYKGSGRSIENFDLARTIEKAKNVLLRYGGHAVACGFSVKKENLNEFIKIIKKIGDKELRDEDLTPKVNIDMELNLEDINEELLTEIDKLKPFGQKNERPIFLSSDVNIVDIITMGLNGQHLKLRLKNDRSGIIPAIGFNKREKWQDLRVGDKIDIVYYLDLNEFNGKREVQMKIVDIKKHQITNSK